ncbi:MAG: aldehyde dehydrogenase family protein [Holophaga sp.]|nr:aldehyde dehydrogenase family protein [Holophaga sp.]
MHLKMNSPAVAHHGKTVIGFNWIGGKELEGDLPSFDAKSAVDTRDTVGIFPECGERDVEKAAKAAAAAFRTWSACPAPARGEVIGRIGAALAKHKAAVAAVITREVGKPPREALAEVQETIDLCRFFEGEGLRPGQADPHSRRRPLGVCAILAGNSSPLAASCWKLIPALLYGNTVVWKPSVNAPTTAYLLIRCMMDAGLAPGAVNVVNGKGRTGCGKFFLAGIDKGFYQKFSFTGSTALGRIVGELAGRNLMVPSLELGGRNPMIVMPDCDLDRAVASALAGSFGCAGQHRTALANLILHRDVAAAFKARFLEAVAGITIGNPITDPEVFYGPMINARFAKGFEEHWAMGRADGARLLGGGARWTEENRTARVRGFISKGFYMQPCVWDEVTPEMKLFQTEVFGPTVNLATVDSFDQAMAYANGTPYGLVSHLHSENREWIERFKRESNAGVCAINGAVGTAPNLPFGGTGWSGNGACEIGGRVEAGYTRWHAVLDDAEDAPNPQGPEHASVHPYEASHWDRL